MKTLVYATATLVLLATPALAQNQTGTGSGMPHQPGDRERALALRNGQVTIEQLGSAAYSTQYDASGQLIRPPAAALVAPNAYLNSGASGQPVCGASDVRSCPPIGTR